MRGYELSPEAGLAGASGGELRSFFKDRVLRPPLYPAFAVFPGHGYDKPDRSDSLCN